MNYTEVIEDYITRWATAYKFIKEHKNYRLRSVKPPLVEAIYGWQEWNLGEDYMEGDVIFTFSEEGGRERSSMMDFSESLEMKEILYFMKDKFGYNKVIRWSKGFWAIERGWNTTLHTGGFTNSPPFIIVIPFENMRRGSAFLNWDKNPWEDLK